MNGLRLPIIAICASLMLSASGQADSVFKFTLTEAQDYAIENFFVSKNAYLDIEAAKKRVWETTAIGLPQVSTSGEYQRYLDDVPQGFPITYNDPNTGEEVTEIAEIFQQQNITLGANVNQLIFSGEYIVGLQAAKVYKLFSEESYEKTTIDLKETVASTYFAILILTENKRVLTKTLENLQLNLEHSEKTFEVGLIEDTDVDQLRLTVKRSENDMNSINNQLATMNRMLKYQLGVTNEVSIILSDPLTTLLEQNVIDPSTYQFNLGEHIEYRLLSTDENLQRLLLNRQKSLLLPDISGFYNYNAILNATAFTPPQHMVGIRAGWTIFQSGMRSAKISQARIDYEQAQNTLAQESQRLILTAQQAQFDYQTALTNYYNEETNFELSEKIFNKSTERYKEGFVSSLELSILNTQYLQAQLSFAMAIQELLTSKVALDKAFQRL